MKQIILILILFNSFTSFSQTEDTLINQYDSIGRKTGKWIEYTFWEGDSLKSICVYEGGQINGNLITYFPSGQISSIINFNHGEKDGFARYYYKSGVVSDIFYKVNDEFVYHILFDTNGKIFQEIYDGNVIQYNDGKPLKIPK